MTQGPWRAIRAYTQRAPRLHQNPPAATASWHRPQALCQAASPEAFDRRDKHWLNNRLVSCGCGAGPERVLAAIARPAPPAAAM